MPIITRFAPSPTGYLHIGGARTALFNYLFARHHGGKFLLRIEDTDRARSTQPAIDAIIDGLRWLGLNWDGEPVFQFARASRHAEVAKEMVAKGQAYYCYCTPEELQVMREAAQAEGKVFRYDGRWRDRDPSEAPAGVQPVIRLKAPLDGEVTIKDKVQGSVTVACKELDDLVLLRADGTPTYMLAVVVDDHDMGITHVIRGDDHLTNAFRQALIYRAMDWSVPEFAHIPLIHGPDGAKLSKRHGALGIEAYRDMGYLPEALRNYLLRLGWAHGDEEIISDAKAIEWFDLDAVGRSPSRIDFAKMENLNAHYIREADDARLTELVAPGNALVLKGMPGLKARAKTMMELKENIRVYTERLELDAKAAELIAKGKTYLAELMLQLEVAPEWSHEVLETIVRAYAEKAGEKLGMIAQPLRAALTGRAVSPGVFEVMGVLGKDESLARLRLRLG